VAFGANLKRERELRGITLDEISKATKISVRLLEAIETDRFDILPSGIFRKSFVKSYAKYLGMNEEQILHEYALQFEISPPAAYAEKPAGGQSMPVSANQQPWTLVFAGLLLLAVCGGMYWFFSESNVEPSISPSTSTTAGRVAGFWGIFAVLPWCASPDGRRRYSAFRAGGFNLWSEGTGRTRQEAG
jgi:transcriptional regulator with XRE-family HTH domain